MCLGTKIGMLTVSCLIGMTPGCQGISSLNPLPNDDLDAMAVVVKALYQQEGRGLTLFVGLDDEDADLLPELISLLEDELGVKVMPESMAQRAVDDIHPVLTPIDPVSGAAGICITLGSLTMDDGGIVRVTASYARSGFDGAIYEFSLERLLTEWSIRSARVIAIA